MWHIRKLIHFSSTARKEYIQFIIDHNGIDPDYPDIRLAFTHPDESSDSNYLLSVAKSLKIPVEKLGYPKTPLHYKSILNYYFETRPQEKEIFLDFKKEVSDGKDRFWKIDQLKTWDSLGDILHPLLMKSVIRGLGTNFSQGIKSNNLRGLFKEYFIPRENPFAIVNEFEMSEKELPTVDKFQVEEIKKKVNMSLIHSVLNPFLREEMVNVDGFIPFINRELMQIIQSLEQKQNEKFSIEEEIRKQQESGSIELTEKSLQDSVKKIDKALQHIGEKKTYFEEVLESYPRLQEQEKFVALLVICGYISETGTDLYNYCIFVILNRYIKEERLKEQWEFLREDIVLETLSLDQFGYLLNCIDLCKSLIQNDELIVQITKENDHKLHKLLKPYIITKNKKLTLDAIDAAIHKICSLGKLHSEKSKWIDILENSKMNLSKKLKPYKLYISKTSVDAYYGDMGGICLSAFPAEVQKDGFYVTRLIEKEEQMVVGMSLVVFTKSAIPSLNIRGYWAAFAFNPLSSLLSQLSYRNQLYLYLQYRKILENLSQTTGYPVVIVGRETLGIVSNHSAFRDLILHYETKKKIPAKIVNDATGISLYYDEACYKKGLLIIDPKNPETFTKQPNEQTQAKE